MSHTLKGFSSRQEHCNIWAFKGQSSTVSHLQMPVITFLRVTKFQKSERKEASEQPVQGSVYKEKTFSGSVVACIPDDRKFPHM